MQRSQSNYILNKYIDQKLNSNNLDKIEKNLKTEFLNIIKKQKEN